MILKIVSLSPASLYAYGQTQLSKVIKSEPFKQKDATSWHVINTTPDLDLHPLYYRIFKDYMILLNSNLNLWIFILHDFNPHKLYSPNFTTVVVVHVHMYYKHN